MDWTPTNAVVLRDDAPTQRVKRRYDNFNQHPGLPPPFHPCPDQYMPGGWPESPGLGPRTYEDSTVSFSLDAATGPSPTSIIFRAAKRICLGMASRLSVRRIAPTQQIRVDPQLETSCTTPSSSPKPVAGDQPCSSRPPTPQSTRLSTFLSSNVPSTVDLSGSGEELEDAHMRNANQDAMNKDSAGTTRPPPDAMGEDCAIPYLRWADRRLLNKLGLAQTPTPPESPGLGPTNGASNENVNEHVHTTPTLPFTPAATPPAETVVYNHFTPAADVILRSPYPVLLPPLSLRSLFKFGPTPLPEHGVPYRPRRASEERVDRRFEMSDQRSEETASSPDPLSEQPSLYRRAGKPMQNWPPYCGMAHGPSTPQAPHQDRQSRSSPSAQLLADVGGLSSRDQSPIIEAHTPDPYHESPFSPPMSGELCAEQQSRYTTRSIAKQKAEAAKQLNGYHIEPLSKEWEAKVEQALQHGHGSYTTHDLVKVVPPMGSKTTSQWLNDETINGYLKLVTDLGNKGQAAGATPKYHAFTSFFMTTLLDKGYEGVKRWSKRAKIDGQKLYEVQDVFIPVNRSFHWTMLVVSPKRKTINYYDSLGGNGRHYVSAALHWLRGELGVTFSAGDWVVESAAASPQQNNSSDCGVFAVTTAKQLMLGRSPMGYGAHHIPLQRRRIVAELVAGRLL